MTKKNMTEKMRAYTTKYGSPEGWTLALKYQVLFDTIKTLGGDTMESVFVKDIAHVLGSLANTENSGVVALESKINDRQWEDTITSQYQCGKAVFTITECTTYRRGIDTDWFLDVGVQHG